jgi:hypothetical protein
VWLAVLTVVVSAGVVVMLIPFHDTKPTSDEKVEYGGRLYDYIVVKISLPPPGQNSTQQLTVIFKDTSFTLYVSNWWGPGGGTLEGYIVTPEKDNLSYTLQGLPSPDPWHTWISPDGRFGVQWDGSRTVRLLVESEDDAGNRAPRTASVTGPDP